MRVIIRSRQKGRTDELIRLCSEAEARGEVSYIICKDQPEAYRISQRALALGYNIGFPITFDEFLKKQYYGQHITNFFMDNADAFLQSLTTVNIQTIVLEEE